MRVHALPNGERRGKTKKATCPIKGGGFFVSIIRATMNNSDNVSSRKGALSYAWFQCSSRVSLVPVLRRSFFLELTQPNVSIGYNSTDGNGRGKNSSNPLLTLFIHINSATRQVCSYQASTNFTHGCATAFTNFLSVVHNSQSNVSASAK